MMPPRKVTFDLGHAKARVGTWAMTIWLLVGSPVSLQAQTIPEEAQLPIFFKLLTYDRSLWDQEQDSLTIGVLYRPGNADSEKNLEAIVEGLKDSALKTVNKTHISYLILGWTSSEELDALFQDTNIDVLYVTAGQNTHLKTITQHTREHDILTLSGSAEYAEAGISVGLDLENSRPQIQVNLTALAEEGHELDSRVLRLCKVVDK